MSKLSDLFKTISTNLHLGELTRPLWENVIYGIDDHETRLQKLEKTSPAALPEALIKKLTVDRELYVQEQARRAQQEAVDAEAEASAAALAIEAQTAADFKAAVAAAANPSGAVASNAVPTPAAQPEAAVAGDPTGAVASTAAVDSNI